MFKCLFAPDLPTSSTVTRSPGECDVLVSVDFSSLNYKDAMVTTGNYPGEGRVGSRLF